MAYVPGIHLVVLDDEDREHATIRGWTRVSWSRRVDRLPAAGAFALAPHTSTEVRAIQQELRRYRKVRFVVDGIARGTGYVAKMKRRGARDQTGPVLTVEVEGALGPALASAIPAEFAIAGQTIREVAENLLLPWGIEVVAGADVDRVATDRHPALRPVPWARMTEGERAAYLADHQDLAGIMASRDPAVGPLDVDLIRYWQENPSPRVARLVETKESRALHPHPDETIGAFLPRLLKGYGLELLEGCDGSAILTTPDYEVRADRPRIEKRMRGGTVHEGTIIESDLVELFARTGEVTVRGKRRKSGRELVAVRGWAQDADLATSWRTLRHVRVTDAAIKDQQEAQRRADTMLRESQFGGYVYTARLAGYAVGPKVVRSDSVIAVYDEEHEVDCDLYVISDEIEFGPQGPALNIECVLPGTWTSA